MLNDFSFLLKKKQSTIFSIHNTNITYKANIMSNSKENFPEPNPQEGFISINLPIGLPRILKENPWTSSFADIKDTFRTGDVILVQGKYSMSWLPKFLQKSPWTHVAMVVCSEDLGIEDKDLLDKLPEYMLWESNVLIDYEFEVPGTSIKIKPPKNLWPLGNTPNYKDGPMLVSLEERIRHSELTSEKVKSAHRSLNFDKDSPAFESILSDIFNKHIDKKFPDDLEILRQVVLGREYNKSSNDSSTDLPLEANLQEGTFEIKEVTPLIMNSVEVNSSTKIDEGTPREDIFCSELLAETFKELDIFGDYSVSNAYVPFDYSEEGKADFLRRAWLGPETNFHVTSPHLRPKLKA